MTADFPWLNDTFASALSNPSDLSPSPYSLYYVSLSIASTYLLACILIYISKWLNHSIIKNYEIKKSHFFYTILYL